MYIFKISDDDTNADHLMATFFAFVSIFRAAWGGMGLCLLVCVYFAGAGAAIKKLKM